VHIKFTSLYHFRKEPYAYMFGTIPTHQKEAYGGPISEIQMLVLQVLRAGQRTPSLKTKMTPFELI
jgi:hypothetical protein